ncbi:Hint domain-containing protein [Celeribacter sp. PS-C1]|uniref:Hint domain-containing protein n=1 Tax=Celeribacter sp. PS-C1 TaxID=2820813 RepID=UPI001CA5CA96|nr:Hint domain-containing protein [Celeribacter sp. PS-C1]MBW6417202.1 Hint domain-containing protein [Celeribacter sp. PS-C1]
MTVTYDHDHDGCDPSDPTDPSLDGVVQGTSGNDLIDTGYTGDPEGDMIDAGDNAAGNDDDIVVAGGGDDTVLAGNGDDIVYGDGGAGSSYEAQDADPLVLSYSNYLYGSETAYGSNNAQPGDSAIYTNVTTLEDGTVVNARLVLVETSDPSLDVDLASGQGSEILLNGKNYSSQGGMTATFRLEFYNAETGEPVVINSTATFNDIDSTRSDGLDPEAVTVDGASFTNFGVSGDSSLIVINEDGTVSAIGTEPNDPSDQDAWFSASFEGQSSITFTLTARDVNSGYSMNGDLIDDAVVTPIVEGNDYIDGGAGNDTIFGEGGDDTLVGGTGANYLSGGSGDDTFIGGAGADTFNGGAGQDNLDYSGSGSAVYVDLSTSALSGGYAENDTIEGGIDGVIGSEYDDTLIGFDHQGTHPDDTYTNEFWGMGGDDTISGGGGDDYLDGGDGQDYIEGGDGNDVIIGGAIGSPDRGYGPYVPDDSDPENDKDTIFGGAGNDTIYGGDDADYIDGGADNDYIDGGFDDDTLLGGSGNDTIIGGEGSDTIEGGDGDDIIYGGLNPAYPDELNIPDDAGDLEVENGKDVIDGGAGNDTIYGQDDDDIIYGGDGDDYIDGGVDNDTIYAGAGTDTVFGGEDDDIIYGGGDNDVLDGGDDQDTFYITFSDVTSGVYNTTVHGGAGGVDWDTLDMTELLENGWIITNHVQNPDSDGNGYDGQIQLFNLYTGETANINYTNIEDVVSDPPPPPPICFTPGTYIATPRGEVLVENLQIGDKAITRDNGLQVIRWIGKRTISAEEMSGRIDLNPVMIRKGALGAGLPERDMVVSPNHRMLVSNEKAALLFEEHEVLVAAKHLTRIDGVERLNVPEVTYIHLMFDRHEVVLSDGTWSESFQPGDYTISALADAAREELFALFPELADASTRGKFSAARRILRKHEAELLVS